MIGMGSPMTSTPNTAHIVPTTFPPPAISQSVIQCGPLDVEIISEELIVMLRQLSYALSYGSMHRKIIYNGAPYNRFFPCMEPLILKPLLGGFGCLELVLYGIRELASQHYEPLISLKYS